jgi:hypothetical protein
MRQAGVLMGEVPASPVSSSRESMSTFCGSIEVTIISATNEALPTVYVDHSREWIEVSEHRFEGAPAEFVAWLRAAADAVEVATTEEPPC